MRQEVRASACVEHEVETARNVQHRLMPGTSHAVRPLAEVAGAVGDKLLCLLGVGSENEFKVRARVDEAVPADTIYVSLFPPRDTLQSIASARKAIGDRRK